MDILDEIRKYNYKDFNINKEAIDFLLDEIHRLRAEANPTAAPPAGKTVGVRVAVVVNPDGSFAALGGTGWDGDEAMKDIEEEFGAARYWLTADLPIPQEIEVAAQVE